MLISSRLSKLPISPPHLMDRNLVCLAPLVQLKLFECETDLEEERSTSLPIYSITYCETRFATRRSKSHVLLLSNLITCLGLCVSDLVGSPERVWLANCWVWGRPMLSLKGSECLTFFSIGWVSSPVLFFHVAWVSYKYNKLHLSIPVLSNQKTWDFFCRTPKCWPLLHECAGQLLASGGDGKFCGFFRVLTLASLYFFIRMTPVRENLLNLW